MHGKALHFRADGQAAPDTIVTLMQTFPGEAVLAIENARLFQEAGRARTAAEAALVDLRRAIQDYDLPRRRLTHRTTMGGTVLI